MSIQKIEKAIKDYLRENKYFFLSLFLFYIIGILLGSYAVFDLDFQQKDEIVKFFNGFLKITNSNEVNIIELFKASLLENLKIILLFWALGFVVIGIPVYYIIIGMRGFCTGFSSGIIIGVLSAKGIIISSVCFLPQEIIILPCLIALAANGVKLSKAILKKYVLKNIKDKIEIKQKIGSYSFVTVSISLLILFATTIEVLISTSTLFIFSQFI